MNSPQTSAPHTPGVVLVTVGSEAEAQDLGHYLVETHLAACVSLMPLQSIYRWQGEVQRDQEWQLVIKTDLNRFEDLSVAIRQRHTYDLPEIIALPITQGLPDYLQWMLAETRPS
ncbi:divalent-cation tolerance protein CutA [Nodosilinea sp. P-1105]|uniref:divalent-cation tolerance protein CutA n=1 Tax=Nodosilinea sp. P-1105 TaxID=2546229 RepID=UPI00146CBB68|nr:divalent-cation tolerance protein CutA [Nodosilinea sp. P-1105]NMF85462.1 divalent-cation tolerance protein CutA [Nodosilinea sp. P-1105]